MADNFNFRIDPADYLGIEYEKFKTEMLELAISKPDKYFQLRKLVLEGVKTAAVKKQYAVYYFLLTQGRKAQDNGTEGDFYLNTQDPDFAKFRPNVPKQKVNEFALKAAKTIDAISEEAVEMILPMNYKKISEDRKVQQTAGSLGFN